MIDKVLIPRYAELSGYAVTAIETKIARKVWREGREWFRAPDGRIHISIRGVDAWVTSLYTAKDGK